MKSFHTIAVPHKDILESNLRMDVFAADLWEVTQGRGPDEYKDAETFFRKTYFTDGLKNLLGIVEKRLKGQGGDPVIQIQTPFGGGKTHALIAMYHSATKWGVKRPVVIVGTAGGVDVTLWALLEKQLTGANAKFTGSASPGKEALRNLLSKNQPTLILMDEVLQYVTKAATVKVGDSNLAAQTIAFMQELTEAVSSLDRTSLVITLPASLMEHFDENAERLYQQLQKVVGRTEKIYTPVQESEISRIIRARLFSHIDEEGTKKNVAEFMKYAEKESILPAGVQPSDYRDRFLASFPFMPEVPDVLYHNWGSFPSFQRTRGVLRLLAMVINSLKAKDRPYIGLADFDLANQGIRNELINHIGTHFNSVIGNDITDFGAGAEKIDLSLGTTFQGLKLGTRAATTIFMYSFSGGSEHGATIGEIKRSATTVDNPAATVSEAVEQLGGTLFFLQHPDERYYINDQPNINRIFLTRMDNIHSDKVTAVELALLQKGILGSKFRVYAWEENSGNIKDTEELKLVILKKGNDETISNIIKNSGQTPRVKKNTLFFLYPLDTERPGFTNTIKRKLAWETIDLEKNIGLSDEQRKYVKKELGQATEKTETAIRELYRIVAMPVKDGIRTNDLGIPTWGDNKSLIQSLYDKLRADGEILERIAPIVLTDKYIKDKDFVSTKQIYEASIKTPGEPRPVSKEVFENGFTEGARIGIFGLGKLENGSPICLYYKEQPTVAFTDNEIIITEKICREQRAKDIGSKKYPPQEDEKTFTCGIMENPPVFNPPPKNTLMMVKLNFVIPKGKVSDIARVLTYLQLKFGTLNLSLTAKNGSMTAQEYEDKVKEAFQQLGIEVKEE